MNEEANYGMYHSKANWVIDPIYLEAIPFEGSDEVVVVSSKKGDGLFFNGKLLAEPIYLAIEKSTERGYLAVLVSKKGEFLLDPEGRITPKKAE